MNAGRDVERLVAHWLAEEADVRAPDRILHSARRSIERTPQRRFVVAWREPMYISPARLAAMAAALAIAIVGGAVVGRMTAPSGPGAVPTSPTPTASIPADLATLESYKAARDEICLRYRPLINPLKLEVENLYDPDLPTQDRADKVVALTSAADRIEALAGELSALAAPPSLVVEQDADVSNWNATVVLIRSALAKIAEGDLVTAEKDDTASDAFGARTFAFESKYELLHCP
jgi:hypothetical protein